MTYMIIKKNLYKYFIHAFILLVIHLVYFNLNWSMSNENDLIALLNKIETKISSDNIEKNNDYLFVNTGYDNSLIDVETEYGTPGNTVVTNREILAELFQSLNQRGDRHKYILCDILFDIPSKNDSLLETQINKLKNIISPSAVYSLKERNRPKLIFNIQNAPAEYITYRGILTKMHLKENYTGQKSLPLTMYEDISGTRVRDNGLFLHFRGSYIPRSIFPRYYVTKPKMKDRVLQLGTLVEMLSIGDDRFYNENVKDKILIIGNLNEDIHNTSLRIMPGSLVLFNTYLSLYDGYHLIHWSWFIFILLSFGFLIHFSLFREEKQRVQKNKIIGEFLKQLASLAFLTIAISIVSSMIFKVHITILPVIIYIESVRLFKKYILK